MRRFGGITNDHDSSKEIMRTDAKSFDSKKLSTKTTEFLSIEMHAFSRVFEAAQQFACTCFLAFLKQYKNSRARVFSGF